ncbi:TPA: hypothetical protein ACOEF8_002043 [Enterobacter roggenkampii]
MAIDIQGALWIGRRPGSVSANKNPIDLTADPLDSRVLFSRASTKLYFADGEFYSAQANEWPVEHDPVTNKPLGRSCEPQRTNYWLNSMSPDQNGRAVQGTGSTLTSEAVISLFGISMLNMVATTTISDPGVYALRGGNASATPSGVAVASLYAVGRDASSVGVTFYADSASVFNQLPLTQQLKRYAITVGSGSSHYMWVGNRNVVRKSAMAIGLFQLEIGDYATSPILTSNLPVTRSADIAVIPTYGSKKIIVTYSDGTKEELAMSGDNYQLPWSPKIYSRIEYA